MEVTAKGSTPKLSISTLETKSNYYVIPEGGSFHYFPVKIEEATLNLPIMVFEKCPPVLVEGIVVVQKKLYEVDIRDLMRGIIRKSREIIIERNANGSATITRGTIGSPTTSSPATDSTVEAGSSPIQSEEQPRAVNPVKLEVSSVADIAWQDQIESLLDFVSSKEGGEWEIEGVAQP